MANEIYNRTVFKRFFELNDPSVLAWAENVLAKVSAPGILPTFIDKENEDFKAYWGTLTHLFALIVLYGRQYNEIDTNKILFELFIENRGLVTDEVNTVEQMQYLFYNYITEYEKRGRLDIISKEGVILGELLRLIQYQDLDEFIFAVLMAQDSGWTLGYSSPTWNRTDTVRNITKGYETTKNVEDLSKYPLINPTGVNIIDDIDNDGNPIKAMTFNGNTLVGIGMAEGNESKLMVISENMFYQLSFKLKVGSTDNQNLKFGVNVYDENMQKMNCVESYGTKASNYFTLNDVPVSLPNAGVYYECRGILSKMNRSYSKMVELNFPNGKGLRLTKGAKYMTMSLCQDRSAASNDVYIYDIKIKPLFLTFYQGYLGEKNIIASYYENNSSSSNKVVNAFIENYLISYRNILASQEIYQFELTTVKFKVFSDRRVQIEGATIEIAGQTLTTDINGEADIQLYPGDYLYSVEKTNFNPITNDVLSVTEESPQIVYIPLSGALYERKIVFNVRTGNNQPVSGAVVTFNGQFMATGADGTATFMAYPGLYAYSVTKSGYYDISRSILVQDDMIETVELVVIPISTITFVVTSGGSPVAGATVTMVSKAAATAENAIPYSSNRVTGADGRAVFENLVNGEYSYSVEKVDWLPISADLTVAGDATVPVTLSPVPTYTVTFLVNDLNPFTENKVPLSGATVVYAGITKTTGSDGTASFVVKGNSYPYTVSASGHVSQSGNVRPAGNTNVTIDLVQNQYTVTFVVRGENSVLLQGATVTVQGKVQETDKNGQTVFTVPNGTYNYTVSYPDYHDITGNFTMNSSNQSIPIAMDQVLYDVTFVVTEEGIISAGATVRITNTVTGETQSKNTSSQGIATFTYPKGSYTWQVSKNIYVTQTGSFTITGSPVTRDVNLIRKNGSVTFIVKDDSGKFIEGATVTCGDRSGTTGGTGQVTFSLPIGEYSYNVSKLPDYTGVSGQVSIVETPQNVNVILSNKTYKVTFTVRVNWGGYQNNLVSNLAVVFNDVTAYTNSAGQAIFQNIKNGTYNYSAGGGNTIYDLVTGSTTVSNEDRSVEINLNFKTLSSTLAVYKDGYRASNIRVTGSVKYKGGNGTNYSNINTTTDSNGEIEFNCPAEGTFTLTATDNGCISKSVSGNNGSDAAIYLWSAWVLTFNTAATSIIARTSWLNSSNCEAVGNTLKVCPPSTGGASPNHLIGGTFQNETSLLSVDQWPVMWGFGTASSTFLNCYNLSSVVSGTPYINGNIDQYFKGCTNLRTISARFFASVTGTSARYCFEDSGLTEVPTNLFSNNIQDYEYCFRRCYNLTTVTGTPFGTRAYKLGGIFAECSSLTTVSINTFNNCSNAGEIGYAFANCTALKTVNANLIQYCTKLTYAAGFFEGAGITALPSNFFGRITTDCNFTAVCHDCKNLTSIGTNAFPLTANQFYGAFWGCSALTDATNFFRGAYSKCTNASNLFRESAISMLPGDAFANWTALRTLEAAFQGCTNLKTCPSATNGLIDGCTSLTTMAYMFNGCTNFVGDRSYVDTLWLTKQNSLAVPRKVNNYNYAFQNCSGGLEYIMYRSNFVGGEWNYIGMWTVVLIENPSASHVGTFRGATGVISSNPNIADDWK